MIQRARDQGRVRRTSSALRPVSTRVHGPGPVGSAANTSGSARVSSMHIAHLDPVTRLIFFLQYFNDRKEKFK